MHFRLLPFFSLVPWLALGADPGSASPAPIQYIIFNRAPGQGMNQAAPESFTRANFQQVLDAFPNQPNSRFQTGISFIFSPFRTGPETTLQSLRNFLLIAEQTGTPILVQIDTEHWWGARPDLWNWWDPAQPGYDPANTRNVEWTGWSPDTALKIAWRNWGRELRVLPPPNLASPQYLGACREEIRRLVPVVMAWHAKLPETNKHLLIGVKLGHESSIGVNAYHYPGGNAYLDKPAAGDPNKALDPEDVLDRGMAQIGFAALKTSGIRTSGVPTEAELRDVVQHYLETLCREAASCGLPRPLLFAHGAGWKDDELMYTAPLNRYACPGWSFYKHAPDPRKDQAVQRAVKSSDAPHWAAAEWLLQGTTDRSTWSNAISNVLADPRCKYVCIFNWESIRSNAPIRQAISDVVAASGSVP